MVGSGILLLAACAGDSARSVENVQFSGVPLPRGYSLDADSSMAFGGGDRWVGRLVFTTGLSTDEATHFFREEMPRYDWGEGAAPSSERSTLTFFSGHTGRVAIVQITSRTLWGSQVVMAVGRAGRD